MEAATSTAATTARPLIRKRNPNWNVPKHLRDPASIDRRSPIGKAVAKFREELRAHVGGNPTPPQAAMIELACQIRTRLLCMDVRFAEAGGIQTDYDSRTYLAWCNSLARLLAQLGMKAAGARQLSLADYLAQREAGTGENATTSATRAASAPAPASASGNATSPPRRGPGRPRKRRFIPGSAED